MSSTLWQTYQNLFRKLIDQGLPWIGRIHDVPISHQWFKFKEWADVYGPIYQTKMLGKNHVWISSEKIANELLSKRGLIYSDRPAIPNIEGTKTRGEYLPLLGYTGLCFPCVSAYFPIEEFSR